MTEKTGDNAHIPADLARLTVTWMISARAELAVLH
jgi:hypothetical protein